MEQFLKTLPQYSQVSFLKRVLAFVTRVWPTTLARLFTTFAWLADRWWWWWWLWLAAELLVR